MEIGPRNDTTHGSIIIVTIMELDGITGGQVGVLGAPMIHLLALIAFGGDSTQSTDAVG